MKNPLDELHETAINFKKIGSVANTQKHLFKIVEAFNVQDEKRKEQEDAASLKDELLDDEIKLTGTLREEMRGLKGELQKSLSLNDIYEAETLEEFKVRVKTREDKKKSD